MGDGNDAALTYLVADDHPSVSLAIIQILSGVLGVSDGLITTYTTSDQLLGAMDTGPSSTHPSVVVLDLVMPGPLKRAQLVTALLARRPNLRVLVYTAEESPFLARAVLDAGAVGFVAKTSPAGTLIDGLRAVSGGVSFVDPRVDLDQVKSHAWASLTDSERAVLLAMARGYKAPEIVTQTGRSYSTVTTHKYNGLAKLGLKDGNDLLPYIYQNGLLHELDGVS